MTNHYSICTSRLQQHVIEYWWEGSAPTAIPPTSASDVMGQHHKIGGTTFREALIRYIMQFMYINSKSYVNFNVFY